MTHNYNNRVAYLMAWSLGSNYMVLFLYDFRAL